MGYVSGENKYQMTLQPMCLDDYVGEDNICRVIEAYVKSLDLATLGFKYAKAKDNGRPPYDPAVMLCLYIYGYMNRIRSSRRLESEAHRNLEVMWLLEKLTPDDKTICNFRKDNADALKGAFREFSIWCNRQGLYGREQYLADQMSLFNEAEVIADSTIPEPSLTEVKTHFHKRTRLITDKLPDNIPIEIINHKLNKEECFCPECSSELHEMGKETRDELKIIPAKAVILR